VSYGCANSMGSWLASVSPSDVPIAHVYKAVLNVVLLSLLSSSSSGPNLLFFFAIICFLLQRCSCSGNQPIKHTLVHYFLDVLCLSAHHPVIVSQTFYVSTSHNIGTDHQAAASTISRNQPQQNSVSAHIQCSYSIYKVCTLCMQRT